eukprot:9322997-Alexandrium_andersonii.AAC.1
MRPSTPHSCITARPIYGEVLSKHFWKSREAACGRAAAGASQAMVGTMASLSGPLFAPPWEG